MHVNQFQLHYDGEWTKELLLTMGSKLKIIVKSDCQCQCEIIKFLTHPCSHIHCSQASLDERGFILQQLGEHSK